MVITEPRKIKTNISNLKEGQFFKIINNDKLFIFTDVTKYDGLCGYHAICINNGHSITLTEEAIVIPIIVDEIKCSYGFKEDEEE